MAKKEVVKEKRKKIDFVYVDPDAASVSLTGSFNDWSLLKHPMKNNGGGTWKKTVMLPPGDYEYKFWVDGVWRQDPENQRCCENCFGGVNSIVCVR
jgi:1,4-alpha-glucan branching enzyme